MNDANPPIITPAINTTGQDYLFISGGTLACPSCGASACALRSFECLTLRGWFCAECYDEKTAEILEASRTGYTLVAVDGTIEIQREWKP